MVNLQFYLEKLKSSDEYVDFVKAHPKAFLCSAFFVIDKAGKDNKHHVDFYDPKDKKWWSFELEEGVKLKPFERVEVHGVEEKTPNKLKLDSEIDFNEIENLIALRMEKENITNKIQKIIMVLQHPEGMKSDVFFMTIFISGMGLIKAHFDTKTNGFTNFEKKSFFEFMRRG